MFQKELYRTSVLAKCSGMLVLIKVDPSTGGPLKCPGCGGTSFDQAPYDWVECSQCYDFALCGEHVREIESQWLSKGAKE